MPPNYVSAQLPRELETHQIERKVCFAEQSSNTPIVMSYSEVDGRKGIKMPKMINLAHTGIRRSARLSNKPKHKYGLFYKFSISVTGACEVAKNPYIFLTR